MNVHSLCRLVLKLFRAASKCGDTASIDLRAFLGHRLTWDFGAPTTVPTYIYNLINLEKETEIKNKRGENDLVVGIQRLNHIYAYTLYKKFTLINMFLRFVFFVLLSFVHVLFFWVYFN